MSTRQGKGLVKLTKEGMLESQISQISDISGLNSRMSSMQSFLFIFNQAHRHCCRLFELRLELLASNFPAAAYCGGGRSRDHIVAQGGRICH